MSTSRHMTIFSNVSNIYLPLKSSWWCWLWPLRTILKVTTALRKRKQCCPWSKYWVILFSKYKIYLEENRFSIISLKNINRSWINMFSHVVESDDQIKSVLSLNKSQFFSHDKKYDKDLKSYCIIGRPVTWGFKNPSH